jgi:class 3 adenylate cyclase/CHASE2 domain-containing sensor protein
LERTLSLWDAAAIAIAAACLVLAALFLLPPVAAIDRLVEDAAVAALTPARPQHPRIAIIAIGEDTLATLPYRAPLDRGFLATLVETLRAKGVTAIGLDVLVDQPSEPAKDDALHRVLAAPGAPAILLEAGPDTPLSERQRRFHQHYLEGLHAGHGALARDRLDGVVRRFFPRLGGLPSLPAAMAAAAGVEPPAAPTAIDWLRTADGTPPFAIYPAEAVAVLPPSWLAGKLVLVGLEVPDADRHRTPPSVGAGTLAGVEIQAHILAQMLDGRVSPRAGSALRIAAVVVMAAGGTALAAAGLSALQLAAAALAGAVLVWGGAAVLFAGGGALVSPLGPSLGWLTAIGLGSGLASVRERRTRALLMGLFAAHLSAPVAAEVWKNRRLVLEGCRPRASNLVATVMFTDVENFTPASESLGPERLMAWIEAYLEAMAEVVAAHGGVVLRFIGDGILAVFGAPLPRPDEAAITEDAERAVRAALAMEGALNRLNEGCRREGLPEIRIRVGMVTGPMVGGSVGGRGHLEYTVMGDVVNTAARLEALAKTVTGAPGSPCRILAAGSTWERVAGLVEVLPVGEVALKGKSAPVAVVQILGLASGAPARREGSG